MTDAERMVELLRYANYARVAQALEVSRASASRWAKGLDVTPFRLRQVEDLLRPQTAGALPATNDELLREMRAIRQLLMRRASGPTAKQVAKVILDSLDARDDGPVGAAPRPARGAGRGRKAAHQAAPVGSQR